MSGPAALGSWHVGVTLPDGRHAYANHDDPIVKIMRRINRSVADPKIPVRPGDYVAVAAWLGRNAEQAAACEAGECGHT
jgi:hypothetical protein